MILSARRLHAIRAVRYERPADRRSGALAGLGGGAGRKVVDTPSAVKRSIERLPKRIADLIRRSG